MYSRDAAYVVDKVQAAFEDNECEVSRTFHVTSLKKEEDGNKRVSEKHMQWGIV
ncbi:unnamed protein product [Dibothriocephalus latus]|uniref:Uncharacterized protein n=1 Tax=Dibothriocephalus latus TaxID=60516 RepID=A0A3P6QPT8_DIBLA|nr:unnamed protein product [Dibothriocephalus latus]